MKYLVLAVVIALAGCPSSRPHHTTTPTKHHAKKTKKKVKKKVAVVEHHAPSEEVVIQTLHGRATWYGDDWQGKATASGEKFDKRKMTAAHRSLKLGTRVRVTNTNNGKSVIVRINDRGPYGKDRRRIIDVSEAAAKVLDFIDSGWCPVTVEVLAEPEESE
jgi:rare lipoprotein A